MKIQKRFVISLIAVSAVVLIAFLLRLSADKPEQNLVIISNKSNLTLAEKQCFLAIRSSNPSINSFAAEIVYHAEKTNEYSWSKNSPGLNYFYKAAIKADLGIGEEQYGIAASQYKEYNGNYVKAQRQKWGDM